jgi:hypothetical protein
MSSLDIFRYSKDDPNEFEIKEKHVDEVEKNKYLSNLLSHSVKISKDIFPDIGQSIDEIFEKLQLENNFNFFVTSDHIEANASCSVMPFSNKPDIIITSKLVELLSKEELKFVLAHEVAHYYYQHSMYPHHTLANTRIEKLNLLNLSRAAEISSDRIGFVACDDIQTSLRAMLKLASGLSDKHINFNFSVYLEQLEELESLGRNEGQLWSSHPNFLVRMRALIWFEMSKEYNEFVGHKKGTHKLKEIDKKIDTLINDLTGNELETSNQEVYDRALLWASLRLYLFDKKFSKEEQESFKRRFGEKKTLSTISFLRISKPEIIDQKIEESFAEANLLLKNEKKKLIDELILIGTEVGKNNIDVLKLLSQFANKLGDERTISLG